MKIPYRILVLGDFAARSADTDIAARRADGTTFGPLLTELTGRPRLDFSSPDAEALRLETAWRSLHFLLRRTNLQDEIVIDLLPATESDWLDRFRSLIRRESAEKAPFPISLVAAGWTFAPAKDDAVEFLTETARAARLAGAPLFAGLSLDTAGQLAGDPAWAAFRAEESAAWLGLAANRFLLREEGAGAPLYASAALALAVVAGRSCTDHGWPTHLSGAVIEDLPIHETKEGFIPTEDYLSPDRSAALAEAGVIPLVVAKNRDQARLIGAPSAHREAALSYRLATSRLTAVLNQPLRESDGIADPAVFEAGVRKTLKTLAPSIADYRLATGPAPGMPAGVFQLILEFTAGPPILSSPQDMKLDFIFGR